MKIQKDSGLPFAAKASTVALLASLGLGGCVAPEYVDKVTLLADMPALELEVRRLHDPVIQLVLTFDPEQLGGCAIVSPSLTASLNGGMFRIMEWGRGNYSLDNEWRSCTDPVLVLQKRGEAPHRFQVTDDSLTITGELGDALMARDMTPVPEQPWTFARGQTVTVRWTPASDLAAAVPVVKLNASGTSYELAPVIDRDLITFTMPEDALGAAGLSIRFEGESEPLSCTGARCRIALGSSRQLSRQIQIQ